MSIVIPALNEAGTLPLLLADLKLLSFATQIIVVDGGSSDATIEVAEALGAHCVRCAKGRGRQLRAGAAAATAPILGFVHADARLGSDARAQLHAIPESANNVVRVFTLKVDSPRWPYRLVEAAAALRTRLFRMPYGDQGLFLSRALYDETGGFAEIPLMEDVEMMRRLKGRARIVICAATITVSARRWERDGVWARSFRNVGLLIRWFMGASPDKLASSYERSRESR
ncbi:MAG: TIGR04283 family arsenosugar biosynthesis glycosyltransferase [Phycisphaerae bacterium]|nr:TIGR04283 family arsenosugar biosynthesis glycosyltransferase [Gemmatimonadaceae bacterium]